MSKAEAITQPEMTEEEAFEVRRRYWESVAAIMRANVDAYLMSQPLLPDEPNCKVVLPDSDYLH